VQHGVKKGCSEDLPSFQDCGAGDIVAVRMFLRCMTRKKDGKEHRYWNVVENRRISGGGLSSAVLYLGEINDSQREAWRKTIEVFEDGARNGVRSCNHTSTLYPLLPFYCPTYSSIMEAQMFSNFLHRITITNVSSINSLILTFSLFSILPFEEFTQGGLATYLWSLAPLLSSLSHPVTRLVA